MPRIGTLWYWRGNAYNVTAVFGATIRIDEIGSGIDLYQTLGPNGWTEPSK